MRYNNDLYQVGDHTEPRNPLGIAQFLNCAMKESGMRKKIVPKLINKERKFVAKITVPIVNVVQPLCTTYGGRLLIPKHKLQHPCPPSLLHKVVQTSAQTSDQKRDTPHL